jgi:hypothetical protein
MSSQSSAGIESTLRVREKNAGFLVSASLLLSDMLIVKLTSVALKVAVNLYHSLHKHEQGGHKAIGFWQRKLVIMVTA